MFALRYFTPSYFPARYFPGAAVTVLVGEGRHTSTVTQRAIHTLTVSQRP